MRLIDAELLLYGLAGIHVRTNGMCKTTELENLLNNAPTVDAVEVVRCKDCKHWNISPGTGGNWGECDKIGDRDKEGGASIDLDTYHDDYCSSGERKETT